MFSQKQDGASFTPAYKALKRCANLVGTNPDRLAAEHRNLTPNQRFVQLKQKLQPIQSFTLINAPGIVQKMQACLIDLNEQINCKELKEGLESVNALHNENQKLNALKLLFANDQILGAIAKYWNKYISATEEINKSDQMNQVFKAHGKAFTTSAGGVLSQKDYDPVAKFWKDLMAIGDIAVDCMLIQAGHKAIFAPEMPKVEDKAKKGLGLEEGEFFDSKQNLVRGPNGTHPPRHRPR